MNDKRPRKPKSIRRQRTSQIEREEAATVVLRTQGNVLPLPHSDQDGGGLDLRTHQALMAEWDERFGKSGTGSRGVREGQDPKGGHSEGQGPESSREAHGSPPPQDGHAGITVISLEEEIRRRRSQEVEMIEANVGEHLTTEEIEKVLFKRYMYEGKIWTQLSYLEHNQLKGEYEK
jgi:hypothetical protein